MVSKKSDYCHWNREKYCLKSYCSMVKVMCGCKHIIHNECQCQWFLTCKMSLTHSAELGHGWLQQVSIKRREGVCKTKMRAGQRGHNRVHWRIRGKSTHSWSLDADTRLNQPCCARATRTPSEHSSPTPVPSAAKSAVLSDLCSWAHGMSC